MQNEKNLKQLFDEYVKECQFSSRLSSETVRGYSEVFRRFTSVMPEITHVRDLTTEMLTEFFMRLQTAERITGKNTLKVGVTKSTIRTYWSKLNIFFEWLVRKSLRQDNPLKRIKPPKIEYEDQRALGNDDIRKLYSAVTLHTCDSLILRRDTAMISILILCGLRLGEFISLEVRDIDFEKKLLTVRGTTSKSHKSRYIPMHDMLIFHLRDYIAERNGRKYTASKLIVSATSDRGLSRQGLKSWVKRLSEKSGVKFHLHSLRHSFACNLAKKDVNAVKIQKLLGHSSLDMTMTYLRSIVAESLQDDINKLSI